MSQLNIAMIVGSLRRDSLNGSIGSASLQFLQGWLDRYVAWVAKHSA